MKISVEISDRELNEIRRFADEKHKGPAIRKLALEGLRLRKRKVLSDKIMAGEWSVEIPDLEKLREDRLP
jgi:hypothetical protein